MIPEITCDAILQSAWDHAYEVAYDAGQIDAEECPTRPPGFAAFVLAVVATDDDLRERLEDLAYEYLTDRSPI